MSTPAVNERLSELITGGDVATCGIVELEVLFSAKTERDLLQARARRALAYPRIAMDESDFARAEDVIAALARTGRHRAVSLPDLLIAAAAERSGLTVLHYDADYDIVAEITGQPTEWVVTRGSL